MRIAVLGNSGSGKSTLANWLASAMGAGLLDLDTVAWEPGKIAVPRSAEAAAEEVGDFCSRHENWVVEGCYAGLISITFAHDPLLLFLNPGEEQCVANCQSRPWEPHKYSSKTEQDERLAFLLSWVRQYYSRQGDMSLHGHRECFATYSGQKVEVTAKPRLDPPAPEVLAWLR